MNNDKMLVVGNWKMNGSRELCNEFIKNFRGNENVIICPPAIYAYQLISDLHNVYYGAQDCSRFKSGSYTGDISCNILSNIGVKYVIIGHSERVKFYGETLDIMMEKIDRCLENGLVPIVCLDENFALKMKKLQNLDKNILVAYEPTGSIGTGIVPTNEMIASVFNEIKSFGDFRTLYGGSVNRRNIEEISQIPKLAGVLIGGASLLVNEFQLIVDKLNCVKT
jgi:triosephosphate isomerase